MVCHGIAKITNLEIFKKQMIEINPHVEIDLCPGDETVYYWKTLKQPKWVKTSIFVSEPDLLLRDVTQHFFIIYPSKNDIYFVETDDIHKKIWKLFDVIDVFNNKMWIKLYNENLSKQRINERNSIFEKELIEYVFHPSRIKNIELLDNI